MRKKGQAGIPVQWFYVLIAGAIILMFFVGIVMQQQESAQQQLSAEVKNKLEGILTGAGASENTFNLISLPQEIDLEFTCRDGTSEYIVNEQFSNPTGIQPIFGPEQTSTSTIFTWAVPFNQPFKITNLLMIGSQNIEYIITGDTNRVNDFQWETDIPQEYYQTVDSLSDANVSVDKVRIISLGGEPLYEQTLSSEISEMPNSNVKGVFIQGREARFYNQKSGRGSFRSSDMETVQIPQNFNSRDSAKYAAMFASTAENYKCNLQKVYQRQNHLSKIYINRTLDMVKNLNASNCKVPANDTRTGSLQELKTASEECANSYSETCMGNVERHSESINDTNQYLNNLNCPGIY